MGKLPYMYTDSEETEETSSSVENIKNKKKKFSILKYTTGNIKKKKCKLHSKSEPEDSDFRSRSRSSQRVRRLHGILKNDKEKDYLSSDEDEESEPIKPKVFKSQDKCLVGRVPRPAGAKPGRGGGVAIIVRKNVSGIQAQESTTSNTKRHRKKRLARKKSY